MQGKRLEPVSSSSFTDTSTNALTALEYSAFLIVWEILDGGKLRKRPHIVA